MTAAGDFAPGAEVMARLAALGRYSEDSDCLTRRYLSNAHKGAAVQILDWMVAAGMSARLDPVGNAVGRYEAANPGAPALLIGSHIDTVRDAGLYDGNLGVVAAIACVEGLHRSGRRLPFALEVIAFGDEEGGRFPTALTGSRTVAGRLAEDVLDLCDEAGTSLRQALVEFGCDPSTASATGRRGDEVLAFVELHIEQGPVLEAENLALGVVTAINGATRCSVEVEGFAGHAGTVPMALRRDALAGAAEMIAAVERRGSSEPELVATVGRIEALPGAVNIVPGKVRFTLDVRAPEDTRRTAAFKAIEADLGEIAQRRGLGLSMEPSHEAPAAACAPWLIDQFEAALERGGHPPFRLPSGAGHDAMSFFCLCPIGMLFLRCAGGISHHPAESVTTEDVEAGVQVLLDFILHFEPEKP